MGPMAKRRKKHQPELSPEAQEAVERLVGPPYPYLEAVQDGDALQLHYSVEGAPGLCVQLRHRAFGHSTNQLEVYEGQGDAIVLLAEPSEAIGKLLLGRYVDAESLKEVGAFLREWRKNQVDAGTDPTPASPDGRGGQP